MEAVLADRLRGADVDHVPCALLLNGPTCQGRSEAAPQSCPGITSTLQTRAGANLLPGSSPPCRVRAGTAQRPGATAREEQTVSPQRPSLND